MIQDDFWTAVNPFGKKSLEDAISLFVFSFSFPLIYVVLNNLSFLHKEA